MSLVDAFRRISRVKKSFFYAEHYWQLYRRAKKLNETLTIEDFAIQWKQSKTSIAVIPPEMSHELAAEAINTVDSDTSDELLVVPSEGLTSITENINLDDNTSFALPQHSDYIHFISGNFPNHTIPENYHLLPIWKLVIRHISPFIYDFETFIDEIENWLQHYPPEKVLPALIAAPSLLFQPGNTNRTSKILNQVYYVVQESKETVNSIEKYGLPFQWDSMKLAHAITVPYNSSGNGTNSQLLQSISAYEYTKYLFTVAPTLLQSNNIRVAKQRIENLFPRLDKSLILYYFPELLTEKKLYLKVFFLEQGMKKLIKDFLQEQVEEDVITEQNVASSHKKNNRSLTSERLKELVQAIDPLPLYNDLPPNKAFVHARSFINQLFPLLLEHVPLQFSMIRNPLHPPENNNVFSDAYFIEDGDTKTYQESHVTRWDRLFNVPIFVYLRFLFVLQHPQTRAYFHSRWQNALPSTPPSAKSPPLLDDWTKYFFPVHEKTNTGSDSAEPKQAPLWFSDVVNIFSYRKEDFVKLLQFIAANTSAGSETPQSCNTIVEDYLSYLNNYSNAVKSYNQQSISTWLPTNDWWSEKDETTDSVSAESKSEEEEHEEKSADIAHPSGIDKAGNDQSASPHTSESITDDDEKKEETIDSPSASETTNETSPTMSTNPSISTTESFSSIVHQLFKYESSVSGRIYTHLQYLFQQLDRNMLAGNELERQRTFCTTAYTVGLLSLNQDILKKMHEKEEETKSTSEESSHEQPIGEEVH